MTSQSTSSQNQQYVAEAIQELTGLLSPILYAVTVDEIQRGRWSMDQFVPGIRQLVQTPEQIQDSNNLSLLISVLLDLWDPLKLEDDLLAAGVTQYLVNAAHQIDDDVICGRLDYGDNTAVQNALDTLGEFADGIERIYQSNSAASQVESLAQEAEQHLTDARGFLNSGNLNEAILASSRAIRAMPNLAEAYFVRGSAYFSQGENMRALGDFNSAIQNEPEYPNAYNDRGRVYLALGQLENAANDFDRAILLNPDVAHFWNNLGVTYERRRQTDQAFNNYTRALTLDPSFGLSWRNRGMIYLNAGQLDRAIADFDRSVAANPGDADALNSRGWAYFRKKKDGQAIQDFESALRSVPGHQLATANRRAAKSRRFWRRVRWGAFAVVVLLTILTVIGNI